MSTPLNENLDTTVLPTRALDLLTKVGTVGDSQSIRTQETWVGQTQKWDMQHVGMFVSGASQQSVGHYFSPNTVAGLTNSQLGMGSAWNDGNTSDHLAWSREWQQGSAIGNYTNHGVYGLTTGGFENAFDFNTRKNSRTLVRFEGSSAGETYERMRIYEYRGSTRGAASDVGWTNGSSVVDDPLFTTPGIYLVNHEIRPAGTFGTSGQIPVGIQVTDNNKNDANRDLQILGSLVYNSPSGEDFPSTGLVLCHTAQPSYSAYDLVNRQSAAARAAMCNLVDGFDLMIFMLGHNNEDSGTYSDNMTSLINAWKTAHTDEGYSVPDILCIAPWAATGSNMDATKASDLHLLCRAGGYGFINLWESYGGVTPDGRTERLDGVSATYALDPIHPDDVTTATAIAKDIEWHFQSDNWIRTVSPTRIRARQLRNINRVR